MNNQTKVILFFELPFHLLYVYQTFTNIIPQVKNITSDITDNFFPVPWPNKITTSPNPPSNHLSNTQQMLIDFSSMLNLHVTRIKLYARIDIIIVRGVQPQNKN